MFSFLASRGIDFLKISFILKRMSISMIIFIIIFSVLASNFVIYGLQIGSFISMVVVNIVQDGEIIKDDVYRLKIIKNDLVITKGFLDKNIIFTQPITDVIVELKQEIIPEQSEVIDKDKSVIGRAVVGGILLGPVGAVVGGMSGIGTKKQAKVIQKSKQEIYFNILCNSDNYLLKVNQMNNNEARVLYNRIQKIKKKLAN